MPVSKGSYVVRPNSPSGASAMLKLENMTQWNPRYKITKIRKKNRKRPKGKTHDYPIKVEILMLNNFSKINYLTIIINNINMQQNLKKWRVKIYLGLINH